jgi:cytochrome c
MDMMEINKIVGATVGALLFYLGVQFFAELIYEGAEEGYGEAAYAYAVEVEEADAGETAAAEEIDFAALVAEADPARGERLFAKCKACHKVNGANATGPHLDGVVGRQIAGVEGFKYSNALSGRADEAWTPENLDGFLAKPKEWAPGTAMGFAGLKKVGDRAAIVAYLQSIGG